jgi:hypothetical protein
MSKKSKHSKAKFKHTPSMPAVAKTSTVEVPQKNVKTVSQTSTATLATLNEQYKYIKPELYRILIIAGIFFVVLIILSFIIH